jgi:hypothetical protein
VSKDDIVLCWRWQFPVRESKFCPARFSCRDFCKPRSQTK